MGAAGYFLEFEHNARITVNGSVYIVDLLCGVDGSIDGDTSVLSTVAEGCFEVFAVGFESGGNRVDNVVHEVALGFADNLEGKDAREVDEALKDAFTAARRIVACLVVKVVGKPANHARGSSGARF